MSVVIETTIGDLTVDLFTEERPVACLNFIKLCKLKYYNFNLFHTVEQGFIAQTGDPTGVGDGGSSVWGVVEASNKRFFEAESLPKIHHSSAGLLSLVSAGKHLVGSQFFFTLGSNLTSLDGVHCVIGEVVEGHETLRKLNDAIVDEHFRPYQDVRITHTVILDDPFPDPRGFQVPSRSPSPSAERLKNGRIAADEDIDDTDGKTMEEIQEMLADREAKARATILEIVGDLPDAEMAPPENVLFVCKLNPVTTDDDLEIIFSRFGKVKGCEVIRDKKSGDSLQYAFVEFEDKKACEAAYFKMDNVLIDDRRIHVDFSQSVAKVKWRGKGRGVEGPDGRIDFNNLREESGPKRGRERNGANDRVRTDERRQITSEERRKAREERHREQEKREQRSSRRSPSRERVERSRYDNIRNRGYQERRDKLPLKRDTRRDDVRERKFEERRRFSRSRSREHGNKKTPARRYSTERRHPEKRSPDRRRQHDVSQERHSHNKAESKRRELLPESEKTHAKKDKRQQRKDIKRKKKKSKNASSSEDTSSDTESESETDTDSSSESETSSSSESSDSSSSEEERKRKKKSKKSKKKKSKAPKKKKKHKK